MIKLLTYLISQGLATQKTTCPALDDDFRGMPELTDSPCHGIDCRVCSAVCPTDAITVVGSDKEGKVALDLGACIACGECIESCPSSTIVEGHDSRIATKRREDLILTNDPGRLADKRAEVVSASKNIFTKSVHARVVSTGCSACDAEIGACSNPVFDIERFGIHIVASPRFADALLVTGPVGKGMQDALKRCHNAMAEPKVVIAVGTCAISGGMHKGGYADANGTGRVLPVDVFVPGCPPHPWSIIHGVLVAMNRMEPMQQLAIKKATERTSGTGDVGDAPKTDDNASG